MQRAQYTHNGWLLFFPANIDARNPSAPVVHPKRFCGLLFDFASFFVGLAYIAGNIVKPGTWVGWSIVVTSERTRA